MTCHDWHWPSLKSQRQRHNDLISGRQGNHSATRHHVSQSILQAMGSCRTCEMMRTCTIQGLSYKQVSKIYVMLHAVYLG